MRQAPPLYVWLCAAALSIGVISTMAWQRYGQSSSMVQGGFIATHARQFLTAPRKPGEVRTLALGSSLLWAAMPATLEVPLGQSQLNWMRMIKSGTGLGYLDASVHEIELAPPDVLVIETNLLLENVTNEYLDQLRQDLKFITEKTVFTVAPWLLQRAPIHYEIMEQTREFPYSLFIKYNSDAEILKRAAVLKLVYNNTKVGKELPSMLSKLAQRGVHVVILDLSRSFPIETAVANEKQHWLSRLRKILPSGNNITYITAPSHLESTLYCDGGHLSAAGKKLFLPWWLAELRDASMLVR